MAGLINFYNMPKVDLDSASKRARNEILSGLIQALPMLANDPQNVTGSDIMNSGFGAMPLTFGGKLAIKAPKESFKRAEALAKRYGLLLEPVGSTGWTNKNESIWKQTGIHFGPDNKPRFEIPDYGMGFNRERDVARMIQEKEGLINDLKTKINTAKESSKTQSDLFPGSLKYNIGKARKKENELIKDLEQPYGGYDSFRNGPAGGMRASYMIDNPGLIENYPKMMNDLYSEYQPELFSNLRGASAQNFMRIHDAMDPYTTTAHELQHHIQGVEGFAGGGDPMAHMNELHLQWLKDPEGMKDYFYINGLPKNKAIDEVMNYYRRLGGEAEARAVQARLPLPPDVLKKTFPLSSYDVPISEIVNRFTPMPPGVDWSKMR